MATLPLLPGADGRALAAGEVAAAEEAFDDAVVRLLIVERRIEDAETLLRQEEDRVARLEEETAEARARAATASADLSENQRRYAERLAESYKAGDLGWLGILLTSDSLSDLLNRTTFLNRILSQDVDLTRRVEEARTRALEASDRLAQATERGQAGLLDLRSRRDALRDAREDLTALVDRLGDRLEEARAAARAAAQRMADLNRDEVPSATDDGRERAEPNSTTRGSTATTQPRGTTGDGPPPGGRALTVKAYAYALRGTTASGVPVAPGVVAVDPRVIPLGTRLWVPGYGDGIAADTGGDIKGNTIDVWMPSERQARDWGVRTVTIIVYD